MSTPAWMKDAACAAPENRDMPWTTDTALLPPVVVEIMATTCDDCVVRSACNTYAVVERVSGGMWAGIDRDPNTAQFELPLILGGAA